MERQETCTRCKGTKEVVVSNFPMSGARKVACPDCNGTGLVAVSRRLANESFALLPGQKKL